MAAAAGSHGHSESADAPIRRARSVLSSGLSQHATVQQSQLGSACTFGHVGIVAPDSCVGVQIIHMAISVCKAAGRRRHSSAKVPCSTRSYACARVSLTRVAHEAPKRGPILLLACVHRNSLSFSIGYFAAFHM